MVRVEQEYLEICNKLIKDINNSIKRRGAKEVEDHEKLLVKTTISVEKKKKKLVQGLYALIVRTFSIDPDKVRKSNKALKKLKDNLHTLRKIVMKLRDINYYMQIIFLEELNLAKQVRWSKLHEKDFGGLLVSEEGHVKKDDFEKMEYTVYKLISSIISLDKSLLKNYSSKEEKIVGKEKTAIKDIEKIVAKESEILSHIEAKLPPKDKLTKKLLKKRLFTEWSSRVLALSVAFEKEYRKENEIFNKIKKRQSLKAKFEVKISHIIKEKWNLLKLKEERLLAMEKVGKMEAEHQKLSHQYMAALKL